MSGELRLGRRAALAGLALVAAGPIRVQNAHARGRTAVGGRVSLRVPWPLGSIDPHRLDDPGAAIFGEALFDSLYARDDTGGFVPALAEDEPELEDIDVFIVPGLGFDAGGRRLGQGGGFYDSALRARPSALRVAPCYDFQVIEAIPCEPHDEPVDVIVTPAGARRTGARPRPGRESEEV